MDSIESEWRKRNEYWRDAEGVSQPVSQSVRNKLLYDAIIQYIIQLVIRIT